MNKDDKEDIESVKFEEFIRKKFNLEIDRALDRECKSRSFISHIVNITMYKVDNILPSYSSREEFRIQFPNLDMNKKS